MNINLAEIPHAFQLPRVDWPVVRHWIEQAVPQTERPAAWTQILLQWFETLEAALGESYRCIRSPDLILFVPEDYEQAVSLFDLCEAGLRETRKLLGDLARDFAVEPLPVLLFADNESYSRYVSPDDPEFESVRTGGVCFNSEWSYVHVALSPAMNDQIQRTALHEIAHACLAGRPLPLWLEEGITQLAEEAAAPPWGRFSMEPDKVKENRRYWQKYGLGDFWWGTGFHTPDEGQPASYFLAQVLFRQIMADFPGKIPEFVRQAAAQDAGDLAARQVLGVDLATIASTFLGSGDWKPVPLDAIASVERGAYYVDHGETEQAKRDLDRAIELNRRSTEAFFHRGRALEKLNRSVDAITDYEYVLELDPRHLAATNNLAWLLATHPDEKMRNGPRALELARELCMNTDYSIWNCVGTLAAALAETGDFEPAVEFANDSLKLAPVTERPVCLARIHAYEANKPWRAAVEIEEFMEP